MQDVSRLVKSIQNCFDKIAFEHKQIHIPDPEWKNRISSDVAATVRRPGWKSYATGYPDNCDGNGWLFDFCTIEVNEKLPSEEQMLTVRLMIAGEIELKDKGKIEIIRDFSKLLIADAALCFMVFQQKTTEGAGRWLDLLSSAVEQRHTAVRMTGCTRLPIFILSCYVYDVNKMRFEHRII